jgi:CBS-domain-containing membrane protein
MQAKDIMTTDVVTVGSEAEAAEVARLMLERCVSAIPVVDGKRRVLGIVSEGDLIRRAECGAESRRSWWLALLADRTAEFIKAYGTRAKDLMTPDVITVSENAPLAEIARVLEAHRIKRVPVVRDGRLVGIVSRADVLRGLASLGSARVERPSANDRQIRDKILELLKERSDASTRFVSVIVVGGAVYLWGTAEGEQDRVAIRVAAENVAGVKAVHDFLGCLPEVLKGVW